MKCLVSFAIFADFFKFLHAVSTKHVFAEIGTNICRKIFSTASKPYMNLFFLLYLLFLVYISDSSVIEIFFGKIAKTIC